MEDKEYTAIRLYCAWIHEVLTRYKGEGYFTDHKRKYQHRNLFKNKCKSYQVDGDVLRAATG